MPLLSGNVKRSDVGNRPNLLSTLGMMQKIFGNTDEARATNGRDKSRKMLGFWITHKLLAKSRDSTDHHKGRDLVMLSLLKPKRGDGDSKAKNMQLLRIWLKKEKALATRVEKQDGGDELLRALKKERMSAELDKAEQLLVLPGVTRWGDFIGTNRRQRNTPVGCRGTLSYSNT